MPRKFLVAGIDYGTSYTKMVIRDNSSNVPPKIVVSNKIHNGLFPSVIGIQNKKLIFTPESAAVRRILHLKMVAADVASGMKLDESPVHFPSSAYELANEIGNDLLFVRSLMAFYFANLIIRIENFIRNDLRWSDFDFEKKKHDDYLIYQLAIPAGLITNSGNVEQLFRDSLICAFSLKSHPILNAVEGVLLQEWHSHVCAIAEQRLSTDKEFEWQCLVYPETAGAVQAYFRSPNATDGLFVTMDVGAGTVDLNAFRRQAHVKDCNYYATIVCPLGSQNLASPITKDVPVGEAAFMEELCHEIHAVNMRARNYEDHLGAPPRRTWDRAKFFIFGGGAYHQAYWDNFRKGLINCAIHDPQIHRLPDSGDLKLPGGVEFGRFAVAYGLSFFKPNLDKIKLPHELQTFDELYPPTDEDNPPPYGFTWDD